MDAGPRLLILIILLLLSAFFSSAETAFTAVNQIQLQLLADEGNKEAKRALWILEHKTRMLSAILIGNNIVNISATALATKLTIDILGNVWVGVVTGILTVAVLIFGEIVPKSLATVFSLQLSQAYSLSIRVIMWLLTPFIKIVEVVRSGVFNIMGVDAAKKLNAMTEDELKSLVDVGLEEGAIEDDEFKMITNVFSLDDSLAKDIMIPRIDMVYVPLDADKDEVLSIYREYNYTRYPVFNDDKDTVIGTINVKDILSLEDDDPFHVGQIMREPHFTFEHKEVGTLLIEMRQEALSIIYVLDEYGSISGMVTLEDILEEIVGEIRDEFDHDEKDPIIKLKGEGEYLIDGTTNLDDVNETLGLSLNSEEYDSIAGYILEYLDRLPKSGEEIILEDGTRIVAVLVRRNRIEKVHLFMNNQDPSSLRSSG
ncbi:MAG: HlyC/CorC family transporter [Lachnospiraceae bacterium]|nr:HlyC/CorC family transporter [Lachnospiraceae bacterium]